MDKYMVVKKQLPVDPYAAKGGGDQPAGFTGGGGAGNPGGGEMRRRMQVVMEMEAVLAPLVGGSGASVDQ